MDIINEINDLKDKINNELESFKYNFLGSDTLLFSLNSSKYRYEVCYTSSGDKYAIKTNNAYNIVSCEKIIDCDLNNKDKVLKK